jgi:diketogulonate reductase-like aldo/keto reductase
MTVTKLTQLLRDAEIPPAANEMELHPHFQQPELFEFVVRSGILPIGYSPLGSPSRPLRDRAPGDTNGLEDPELVEIADELELTPAQVCIKWAIDRGQVPIPFSVKRGQFEDSMAAACLPPLSPQQMERLARLDRNSRLIKGQVFLWPEADDWRDLWDGQP